MKKELIQYVIESIRARKTRSFLTTLSIFFGVMTLFIFISFGLGLYNYTQGIVTGSSANKIIIQSKGGIFGSAGAFKLGDKDLRAVENSEGVLKATGIYLATASVQQGRTLKYALIIGYDPTEAFFVQAFNMKLSNGRNLNPKEVGKVVLGASYTKENKIFPKKLTLNDRLNLLGRKVKIAGFYKSVGNPQDDSDIFVTNQYFRELFPNKTSYYEIIATVNTKNINQTIQNVEKNLRRERGEKVGEEDFFVQSFSDLMKTFTSILNVIVLFIVLVALISVVVSSINTSNTMISSVLEKVKEIGTMKAIGAKNSEILSIFLFESGILGFIAGVLGVSFGYLLTSIGAKILVNLGYGFLQPQYSIYLFGGVVLFATITGAVSGFFPAMKASKTNPVDALREE